MSRIGQTTDNPQGNDWGVMTTDDTTLDFSEPSRDESSSSSESSDRLRTLSNTSLSSHSSYCVVGMATPASSTDDPSNTSADELNVSPEVNTTPTSLHVEAAGGMPDNNTTSSASNTETAAFTSSSRLLPDSGLPSTASLDDVGSSNNAAAAVAAAVPAAPCPVTVCVGEAGVAWRYCGRGCLSFRPGVSCSIPQGANTRWWMVRDLLSLSFI